MVEWVRACDADELNSADPFAFDYGEKKIMLARFKNTVYATDRICTHAYADLSTGFMNEDERTITCPLHMSSFKLEDGVPQNLPAEEPLKTYKTEIRDKAVYVMVD
jgi:nitrite reductase/ring-hydroxylating ferredoxin subunit